MADATPDQSIDLDAALAHELAASAVPTAQQLAQALAAAALVSPAALGGMPVLPVTADDERRRIQEQMQQESASTVGSYQEVDEAAAALALSQSRLAAVTRLVEGTHERNVSESAVVSAAHKVAHGEATPHQQREFAAALGRVATDSADLFMLLEDARREQAQEADQDDEGDAWDDEGDEDDWDDD